MGTSLVTTARNACPSAQYNNFIVRCELRRVSGARVRDVGVNGTTGQVAYGDYSRTLDDRVDERQSTTCFCEWPSAASSLVAEIIIIRSDGTWRPVGFLASPRGIRRDRPNRTGYTEGGVSYPSRFRRVKQTITYICQGTRRINTRKNKSNIFFLFAIVHLRCHMSV